MVHLIEKAVRLNSTGSILPVLAKFTRGWELRIIIPKTYGPLSWIHDESFKSKEGKPVEKEKLCVFKRVIVTELIGLTGFDGTGSWRDGWELFEDEENETIFMAVNEERAEESIKWLLAFAECVAFELGQISVFVGALGGGHFYSTLVSNPVKSMKGRKFPVRIEKGFGHKIVKVITAEQLLQQFPRDMTVEEAIFFLCCATKC